MIHDTSAVGELAAKFGPSVVLQEASADAIPTLWVGRNDLPAVLRFLKNEAAAPYRMLYDLTAIDEPAARRSRDRATILPWSITSSHLKQMPTFA